MDELIALVLTIAVLGTLLVTMGITIKCLFDFLCWPFVQILKAIFGLK